MPRFPAKSTKAVTVCLTQKRESAEGGYRAPLVVRWPVHLKPGTVTSQMMAALDWVPTLVDIAGGPKGGGLKKQIEAGQYPGIVKTTFDGFDRREFLEGSFETSAREMRVCLCGGDRHGRSGDSAPGDGVRGSPCDAAGSA